MTEVHSSSVVHSSAELGKDVKIGPFCDIGPHVVLGDGVEVMSHAVIAGHTSIGARSKLYPFTALGLAPQHLKYQGEPSRLEIGSDVVIREHVTMHPGTKIDKMLTKVGNGGYFMAGSHVAHDCIVGDDVVFANGATIGGHVTVGDRVIMGGLAAVHQWVRVGRNAFVGGMSGVGDDIIPFGSVLGSRAHLTGLNIVGLKRNGYGREDVHTLRQAYRMLFASEGTFAERMADVTEMFPETPLVGEILDFIRAGSDRALCTPRNGRAA
ncbi:MAG: acyl-ACP--UDP-N-acetylglucosamine O-acyltransferase [Pseudomonadota bacterium]